MGKLLMIMLFGISYSYVTAQIEATTSNGRKVKLNNDGTWEYVQNAGNITSKARECETKKYGKVCFNNNTESEIYVWVGKQEKFLQNKIRILAGKTQCVDEMPQHFMEYEYKVMLENPSSDKRYDKLDYKTKGNFNITPCGTKTIDIDVL